MNGTDVGGRVNDDERTADIFSVMLAEKTGERVDGCRAGDGGGRDGGFWERGGRRRAGREGLSTMRTTRSTKF